MTREEAVVFLKKMQDIEPGDERACINGHFQCSTVERGPCLDQVLHEYPDLEDLV